MGSHPFNLGIRFLLEFAALIIFGMWGWQQGDFWIRYLLVAVLPISTAAIWDIFAVPNDPSRSSKAPIAIPGFIRIVVELVFFALATLALHNLQYANLSLIIGIIINCLSPSVK